MDSLVRRLGNTVSKSRSPVDTIHIVPPSEEYVNDSNTFLGFFGSSGPLVTHSAEETIVYTNQPPSTRGKSNFCMHTKKQLAYGGTPSAPVMLHHIPGNRRYKLYAFHIDSKSYHLNILEDAKAAFTHNLGDAVLNGSGQAYINTACEQIRPDLTTISLPNFLIEIDQIQTLWTMWKYKLSDAKRLYSTAKFVAGVHLGLVYGARPLDEDLHAITGIVFDLNSKLKAFIDSCGKIFSNQVTIFNETLKVSGTKEVIPGSGHFTNWNGTLERRVTAHITWKPQALKAVGDLQTAVRVLLDSFGIELNPRILWDAIPFSFVVDWFLDVGSVIGRYRIDAMELPIQYVDSYLQYKEVLTVESRVVFFRDNPNLSPHYSDGGWVTKKEFFHRLPILPDYWVLTSNGWKLPSLNQAYIGLSLATVLDFIPDDRKFWAKVLKNL